MLVDRTDDRLLERREGKVDRIICTPHHTTTRPHKNQPIAQNKIFSFFHRVHALGNNLDRSHADVKEERADVRELRLDVAEMRNEMRERREARQSRGG